MRALAFDCPEGFANTIKVLSLLELMRMADDMKVIPEDANYRKVVLAEIELRKTQILAKVSDEN